VLPAKAIIVAVLIAVGAAVMPPPQAGAAKPCPIDYCTDPSGEYVLEVPPLGGFLEAYADCVWNAYVDFGDGTSQVYVFDASVGLTGSHVFPTAGVTYTVVVILREGAHAQGGEPCPDYSQSAEVLFRTPAEEADDPPPNKPIDEGGTVPDLTPVAPDGQTPNPWTAPAGDEPSAEATRYWRRCRGGVHTHLVSCRKARRVARAAIARLARPGNVQAGGFACRLPPGVVRSIVCQRGEQSILVPSPERGRR
jgi:hypothetical protein